MTLTEADLDRYSLQRRYDDGTFIRIMIRRTENSDTYPSGWHYALHYGAVDPNRVERETLADGTLRRYDNAHEDTKGHELHVGDSSEPIDIEFPGMVELYDRFWSEIPKRRTGP